MDQETDSMKPVILLIGEIVLAHEEWDALRAIAQLRQLKEGTRTQFLCDLTNGVYHGVFAISRTFDSTQITGRFDSELVSSLPSTVKFISHNGAGYDSVDAAACAARGISVSNTPGTVDASTANTAIYLILGALRRSHIPGSALRAGKWRGHMGLAHDPENKMLGILGMGGIGSATAKRAMSFGMSIQYHNRQQLAPGKNPFNIKYVDFEKLLRTSDVISVHLPLNDNTKGLIGRREFGLMKRGVTFVNTARGSIVDEQALVEALESGHIWGAGLDVYDREPIVHEGLLRNDHCVLMPHVGTATFDTQMKMELLVIENLKSAIKEGKQVTPVIEARNMLRTNNNNSEISDRPFVNEAIAQLDQFNNGATANKFLRTSGNHHIPPDKEAVNTTADQSAFVSSEAKTYSNGLCSDPIETNQIEEELTLHQETVQEEHVLWLDCDI